MQTLKQIGRYCYLIVGFTLWFPLVILISAAYRRCHPKGMWEDICEFFDLFLTAMLEGYAVPKYPLGFTFKNAAGQTMMVTGRYYHHYSDQLWYELGQGHGDVGEDWIDKRVKHCGRVYLDEGRGYPDNYEHDDQPANHGN